ncbi:hypothetical protein KL86DYS2_12848 [uncultured Dysgonomonas sp.]|uniref:Uncharacterized protein n=1 Tax=uncultured Dysgonomonas sp. TaxID=206096 RepID=A0A212K206_9BACT|nr:hypothetical protein KL86DYS2_12848 [uncultured Dysgonomonas sp.]
MVEAETLKTVVEIEAVKTSALAQISEHEKALIIIHQNTLIRIKDGVDENQNILKYPFIRKAPNFKIRCFFY